MWVQSTFDCATHVPLHRPAEAEPEEKSRCDM
jgi:hypothetical protein